MQSSDKRGVLLLLKRDSVGLSFEGDPTDTQYLDTTTSTVALDITAYFYSATEYSKQDWEAISRLSPDPSVTALFQQILKAE